AQVRRFRAVTRNLHSVELQNRAMSRASTRIRFIEPQLPTLVDQPPEGADWIHEIKHDGYRTMLVLERGKACAYTRNGHDWSDRYSGIIRAAVKHPCRAAILDGLRNHLLVERRAKLQTLLRCDPESPIQFSEEFIGDASAFFGACAAHELERIVSKLATSRYRSGRSKTWLKTKCFTESEFFLLGIDHLAGTVAAAGDGEENEAITAVLRRISYGPAICLWLAADEADSAAKVRPPSKKHDSRAVLITGGAMTSALLETHRQSKKGE